MRATKGDIMMTDVPPPSLYSMTNHDKEYGMVANALSISIGSSYIQIHHTLSSYTVEKSGHFERYNNVATVKNTASDKERFPSNYRRCM